MVEGTALEKRHTRKGIESSNLSLSATDFSFTRAGYRGSLGSGNRVSVGDIFSSQFLFFLSTGAAALGIVLFFVFLLLFFQVRRIKKDLSSLFSGKKAADLESVILKQKESIDELDREVQELYDVAERLYLLGQESLHKSEILRFNPFKEVGGNHSFTVALLNGKNTGFVLSSLHTREGTRVYAKPVVSGAEHKEYPFTTEEKQVIATASKKHSEAFTKKPANQ